MVLWTALAGRHSMVRDPVWIGRKREKSALNHLGAGRSCKHLSLMTDARAPMRSLPFRSCLGICRMTDGGKRFASFAPGTRGLYCQLVVTAVTTVTINFSLFRPCPEPRKLLFRRSWLIRSGATDLGEDR